MSNKILITGTGRSGTTFLIKLFSFLQFDTGYTRETYKSDISPQCNSGMERLHTAPYYVLKNPRFIADIQQIVEDSSIHINCVIIPLRDLRQSASSRVSHAQNNGGLWNATDLSSQIQYYESILANYMLVMTKFNIPTIFLDFDQMICDKAYVFQKLEPILNERHISFDAFCTIYDEVAETSRPNTRP